MLQEFTSEIEKTARDITNDVHTALPGQIVSFNPGDCTASVKPYGKFAITGRDPVEYPVITEAPVVFPVSQSSGAGIAFPVKAGDSCLIIISEVELDAWRSGADSQGSLRFDLSSAIVIPGMWKGSNELASRATAQNAVIIRASGAEIAVSGGNITMTGSVSTGGNVSINGNLSVNGNISCSGSYPGA